MTDLSDLLGKFNRYVRSYKTRNQKVLAPENRLPPDFVRRFYYEPSADQQRYNDRIISKIAAVFETADGTSSPHRHNVTVYGREG